MNQDPGIRDDGKRLARHEAGQENPMIADALLGLTRADVLDIFCVDIHIHG